MPIAKTRHFETRNDGKPVFIVRCHLVEYDERTKLPIRTSKLNEDYTRRFLGVDFIRGVGRTKYAERARQFSEVYGYEVQLPDGYEAWPEIRKGEAVRDTDHEDDAAEFDLPEDPED